MDNFIYLTAWIILPILVEFIPTIYNFFYLLNKKRKQKISKNLDFFPDVTIIIPVYNSSATLKNCIKSINDSTYPNSSIEIMLIDNGSSDKSFDIFQESQLEFNTLSMNWMSSKQGKSRALNKALFNANGKYIINIDSDGKLDEKALENLVWRFENDKNVDCMTGTILIEPDLIEQTTKPFLHLFRKLEFFEYCQAFLASRNYESETNGIFTLSGAFSAFRKSIILKTQLYNTSTICEDTHLTFQVKYLLGKKIHLCEDAFFYVDPIDDFNKYYTQRQRWQIGELEVFNMFFKDKKVKALDFLFNKEYRTLLLDHTFSFPKFVWYFALLFICSISYSIDKFILFSVVLYGIYVFCGFLYFFNIISFLEGFPEIRKYYIRNFYCIFFMPIYTFIAFFVRFAGIINSINRKSSWKTDNLSQEHKKIRKTIKSDFKVIRDFEDSIKRIMEDDDNA